MKRSADALSSTATGEKDVRCTYVIALSVETRKSWPSVLDTLRRKHPRAHALIYKQLADVVEKLQKLKPQYLAIIARPTEAGRQFVKDVHEITCRLDPTNAFTDVMWGIITGHNEASARAMAAASTPLAIKNVVSGSVEGVDLDAFEGGVAFNELVQGHGALKSATEGTVVECTVDEDATFKIVDAIEDEKCDMIITSGHATEIDWNIGFRFPGGQFRPGEDGSLHAYPVGQAVGPDAIQPTNSSGISHAAEESREINAGTKDKVYSAAGNCLMGHINSDRCMALSWMHAAGVRQMVGYTEPTWFGYAGWGVHRYLWANVGALTFAEAYFANQQALRLRLQQVERELSQQQEAVTPEVFLSSDFANQQQQLRLEQLGLTFDLDTTVLFGDPLWEARMVGKRVSGDYYTIELKQVDEPNEEGIQHFQVVVTTLRAGCWTPTKADDKTTLPGRPPFLLHGLSFHEATVAIRDLVVTRLFLILPLQGRFEAGETIVRRFEVSVES